MPKQVQFRRGSENQNNNFTGAPGELSVNETNNSLRVHDGSTAGGHELAKKDLSNTAGIGTLTANELVITDLETQTINLSGNPLDISSDVNITGIVTAPTFVGNLSGTATTATNLSNAANITTGTINAARLSGSYDINVAYAQTSGISTVAQNLTGNPNISVTNINASGISTLGPVEISSDFYVNSDVFITGIVTAPTFVGNLSGTATTATNLSNAANITTGIIDPQRIASTNDLDIYGDLYIQGNVSVGGTTFLVYTQELVVKDKDIVVGYTTDSFGNDISNDTTANHGGIAVASTEGSPLVQFNSGIETTPHTYKKFMWFKQNSWSGLNTDAWLLNYGVGIGSTQIPSGTYLAAGNVKISEYDITSVRNINASGIVTASSFVPSSGYIKAPDGTNSFYIYSGTGNVAFQGTISASQVNNSSGYKVLGFQGTNDATFENDVYVTGITSSVGGFVGNLSGTATTATNLSNAANITTGTINSSRLSGSYDINVTTAGYAQTAGISTVARNLTGNPNISVTNINASGISTLGSVSVSSGIISAVSGVVTYYGDGSNLFGVSASKWQTTSSGINTSSNVGIGTTNPTSALTVSGDALFTGIITASNLNISGTSTLNSVRISSGIVTATSGIITYYGDGSKLSNIISGSSSQWVTTSAGIHTLSNVGIGTTNPIQQLQVGAAGTTVVVIDSMGDVGIGITNPTSKLHVLGDINLDDGGTYSTTLQTITPTANRVISFPDATGTVALVAGSSGQLLYNNAGALAGLSSVTFNGNVNLSTRLINNLNATASNPPFSLTGTWFTGGTATTTKPHLLIEPSGTTSTAWSTSGTGLGLNAGSGFTGRLLDLQLNGTSNFNVSSTGAINAAGPLVIGGQSGVNSSGFLGSWNSGAIGFTASANWAAGVTLDVLLRRDAADTLALRNSTIAQTFRVYGTESSSLANYVRAALSSTSTDVTFAAESAGTGAANVPINLTAKGTGTVKANSNFEVADAKNIVLGTTTGTKIGTSTSQKLGFYDKTPVVQPTAVADITTTATTGTLPTANGTVTIADAAAPTNAELLEYCVELEAKLEAALGRLRDLGLIAT